MLSVEVFTGKEHFAVNVFSSKLITFGQNKFSINDSEMRSNQSIVDEKSVKIIIEHVHDSSLDDPVPPHSPPIQCCSPNIDGELVITTNQSLSWSNHVTGCGEHQIPYHKMKQHCQHCLVAKRNILAAMQDGCTFNVTCVAVQESVTT